MTTGRNVWWVVYFIYVPVYAVESGLGAEVGGAIVSMGTGFMFLAPITGRLVRRVGLRRVFLCGYLLGSVSTFLVAAASGHPWIGRSEEHTSELQSLMRISYAVFCLKKKNIQH